MLVTPTLATAAFEQGIPGPPAINGKPVDPHSGWMLTYPFNMTGHPAASIPCGFTAGNLPVGLQVIGGRFAESTILKVSAAFERARPWAGKKPELQ